MIELHPIGIVEGPFDQKFGVPRQAALASEASGILRLDPQLIDEKSLREIETFSHIWVITWFHLAKPMNGLVRPPRLGGNKRVGVFATRSPNHPNPLGLSLVKLNKREGHKLFVSELDIVNGTPIVDIKPYVKLWDSCPDASLGWIDSTGEIPKIEVKFSQKASLSLRDKSMPSKELIEQVLSQDPRPAYKKDEDDKIYGVLIQGRNVLFQFQKNNFYVVEIKEKEI